MITIDKILDEVNRVIYAEYPEADFHIQDVPEDFKRPSFFIEFVTDNSSDNNRTLTNEKVSIQIVYFAPVNEHQIRPKLNQLSVYSKVKEFFRKGYLQVEDRALKITNLDGGQRDNEVYISLDFEFAEAKPIDAEVSEMVNEINFS